ncbi:MAG: hypothetical protein NTY19_51435 [Planctomycetota bacterium]|nr:hypothetical protein [Planctomycetota bacterium]
MRESEIDSRFATCTCQPAYQALHQLIKEKWWTNATTTTNPQGRCRLRGTLGEYRLTIQRPDQPDVIVNASLVRKDLNEIVVEVP